MNFKELVEQVVAAGLQEAVLPSIKKRAQCKFCGDPIKHVGDPEPGWVGVEDEEYACHKRPRPNRKDGFYEHEPKDES